MTTEAKEKTPAELEAEKAAQAAAKLKADREAINVTTNEENNEEEDEEGEGGEGEKELAEGKEKIAANEKTAEELEAEKKAAKTEKEKERIQKRIDKLTADKKILQEENAALKKKLEEQPDKANLLTEEDVEKRSEEKANQKAAERAFVAACNKLFEEATKVDKDFEKKMKATADEIGPIPSAMIGVLEDLDNGGAVLSYLANNVDEAEEIFTMSVGKMGIAVAKLSAKIEAEKRPKPKEISKVPNPPEALGGKQSGNAITLSDKDPMDEWVRKRNAQVAARAEAKRQGMR